MSKSNQKADLSKPSKVPAGPTQGGRQEFKRTGNAPTTSNTGAAGKPSTSKTY
jgi:hypothetical protein